MLSKSLIFIFLFISSELVAQHPDYTNYIYKRIHHKFDNYKTPEILDAEFILNRDTIKFEWDKDSIYGIGYPISKKVLENKVSISITHPNYKQLVLDSVWVGNLYLFQNKEEFYIENGMPISLNHGREYISVKIRKNNNTANTAKNIVTQLCKKYKFDIAVSFQDSIKKINQLYGADSSQELYGCLEDELDFIFWLQKRKNKSFDYKKRKYKKIRKNKNIEWMGIPQEFSSYIINGIEIEFRSGIDSKKIESLIKKYKLKIESIYKSKRIADYQLYSFTTQCLIPENRLMQDLMKESIVKYVRPKKVVYQLCE